MDGCIGHIRSCGTLSKDSHYGPPNQRDDEPTFQLPIRAIVEHWLRNPVEKPLGIHCQAFHKRVMVGWLLGTSALTEAMILNITRYRQFLR